MGTKSCMKRCPEFRRNYYDDTLEKGLEKVIGVPSISIPRRCGLLASQDGEQKDNAGTGDRDHKGRLSAYCVRLDIVDYES